MIQKKNFFNIFVIVVVIIVVCCFVIRVLKNKKESFTETHNSSRSNVSARINKDESRSNSINYSHSRKN